MRVNLIIFCAVAAMMFIGVWSVLDDIGEGVIQ